MSEDAQVRAWTGFAYAIADRYFLPGADADDARQEALIGLLAAVRTWDESKGNLKSFIALCVERHVITALKAAKRQKHELLNTSLRVVRSIDGREFDAVNLATSNLGRDPHLVLVEREAIRDLARRAGVLTDRERRAIGGVTSGRTYCEIEGVPEGAKPKWVDNAVQRARRKLAA